MASKLRELLQVVERQGPKECSTALYSVMEALVEEWEAQRQPAVDARITELTNDRDGWKQQYRNAKDRLITVKLTRARLTKDCKEAKAEIETLRESQRWWKRRCDNELLRRKEAERLLRDLLNSTELADARAEIELLQAQRDLERAAVMMGKPIGPEAEARFGELKAKAELGELVRGMGKHTKLVHGCALYWAERQQEGIWTYVEDMPSGKGPLSPLRAIQEEVGDGEVS